MSGETELRPGEEAIKLPERADAAIYFIGRIRTPWARKEECPRQGDCEAGPVCRIDVFELFVPALEGIEPGARLQVLYWMDRARRDLARQRRRGTETTYGTFALRSPVRPNPIAVSTVVAISLERSTLLVRGLDCIDGTPLIDLKPEFCPAIRVQADRTGS
jgi:tRNA-Thr(GGU) m(6)t(6)A37 methyltransferase TsaA